MADLACSGVLIDVGRSDSQRAVLLTNVHCVRETYLRAGEVIQNKPYTRSDILVGIYKAFARVHADRVLYGTMTDVDLGLIELQQ